MSDTTAPIFIHVPRTGGRSLRAALPWLQCWNHAPAQEVRSIVRYGRRVWDAAPFRFTIVRNPWDRLVSWYHHATSAAPHSEREAMAGLSRFMQSHSARDALFTASNRSTKEMITDSDGGILVDHVYRYEAGLETIALDVCRRSNWNGAEPALAQARAVSLLNQWIGCSDRLDYRCYYDDGTRALVAEAAAWDIETFRYRFEP